jgi:hypothetical protein
VSPEKSRRLIEISPDIFRGNCSKLPFPMFGFECGDGWFELLKDLIEEIKGILEKMGSFMAIDLDDGIPFKVDQVKEKYGTLRFYTNWTTDEIGAAIDRAEDRSGITCDECGKPGKLGKRGGWMATNCKECFDSYNLR